MIKHLFFDLDHTLWDFEKNSELTFKQIFKERDFPLDFNLFMDTYRPINLEYWRLFRDDKISKEALRYRRLKDSFDRLNYEVSDEDIQQIAIDYIDYLPNYNHLFDAAIEVLEYLKKSYELHIITNGFDEVQKRKLESSGIAEFFTVVVTSESVGVKKPNPKVFEFALEQANCEPSEAIMIGDSYEADVLGALNVGIKAIHFSDEEPADTSVIAVNSLPQLKQYL